MSDANAHRREPHEDEPEVVIEYVPKKAVNWWVVAGLVLSWVLVLAAIAFVKMSALRVLLPMILLALIVYLSYCTYVFLRADKR